MTPHRMLALHDRVADAPDAIPRLRRFILDLAVRGKLVEQDSTDEPAAELLRRIDRLVEHRPTRRGKQRDTSAINALEKLPFDVPSGWSFAALGRLVRVLNGRAYKQQELLSSGTPVLRVGNLFTSNHWYFSDLDLDEDKYCESGDLIYAWSASFGPFIWSGPRAIFHYHIWKLPLLSEADLCKGYLLLFLQQKTREIKEAGHGMSMVHMTKEKMERLVVPLPPLGEQHRIVAKVEELMGLLDRLEAERRAREGARDRLTTATLARLTAPEPDPALAATHTRFALKTLPTLTTRPDQLKHLRQTILNLAVRGKLVEQDPEDEPASALLARIAKSRASSKKKADTNIEAHDTAPFDLPAGWAWARFPELGVFGRGKSKHRPRNDTVLFDGGTHLMIQTGDVARSKGVISTYTSRYNDAGLAQSMKWPSGTLCITIAANIADTGILSFDACFPDSVVGFQPSSEFENARYFEYFMRTAKENLLEFAPATAQKNINLEILSSVLIPLPPLAEQQRIVAKVDALMALCDSLEASLTTANTTRQRLLESLLDKALNPAEEREMEAAE